MATLVYDASIDPNGERAANSALRSVERATGRPLLIALKVFSLTRIGAVVHSPSFLRASTTSFHRGQTKSARSFFFAIPSCFQATSSATPGAAVIATSGCT